MQRLSTERSVQILLVDDETSFQNYISRKLTPIGYQVVASPRWEEARSLINDRTIRPDMVLVDPLSHEKRVDALTEICLEVKGTPVIVVSALRDPRSIASAIRSGALDYLVKPVDIDVLQQAVNQSLYKKSVAATATPATEASVAQRSGFLFSNPKMKQIQDIIHQVANTRVSVLLLGESGVGKDVIARAIHQQSNLRNKPFVKVNCAAMPAELMESELFGCEKGAYTGAYIDRPGKFEFANGGTILLDEIAEFTPSAQAKLLQVLQDGKFTRLGSNQEIEVEVRVIAATNRKLEEAIEKGAFREDLFYRLNVVSIEVPPLRDRRDEIELYSKYFFEKFSAQYGSSAKELPEALLKVFLAYRWPGNVRELENLVKRFVVLQDEEAIRSQIEGKMSGQSLDEIDQITDLYLSEKDGALDLKEIGKRAAFVVERNMISKTLLKTNWNKWRAAKELRVSYKTLLTKIEQYDIRPPGLKGQTL